MKTFLILLLALTHCAIWGMETSETALRLKASLDRENILRQELSAQLVAINSYRNQIAALDTQIKLSQETLEPQQASSSAFWSIAKKGIPTVFGFGIGILIGCYAGSQHSSENNKDKKIA